MQLPHPQTEINTEEQVSCDNPKGQAPIKSAVCTPGVLLLTAPGKTEKCLWVGVMSVLPASVLKIPFVNYLMGAVLEGNPWPAYFSSLVGNIFEEKFIPKQN